MAISDALSRRSESIQLFQRVTFPHELFYGNIIPYSFSAYLYRLIVHGEKQDWNPFVVLPLVCKRFRGSCRLLLSQIFGKALEGANASESIRDILIYTRKLWQEARKLPLLKKPRNLKVSLKYESLMSSESLIQIYMCAGYAKYHYTMYVLNPLCLDRLWITGDLEPIDFDRLKGDPGIGVPEEFLFRPFEMADDRIPLAVFPLLCSMKLCDRIRSVGLVDHIADYLARKAVTYGTEPMLLKDVQVLEMNMARKYANSLESWSMWTENTLHSIAAYHTPLKSLQEAGNVVAQYSRPSELTMQTIRNTRVLEVLRVVSLVDWGSDTLKIRQFAKSIIKKFRLIHDSGVDEPGENDEYFVDGGKKMFFSEIFDVLSYKELLAP